MGEEHVDIGGAEHVDREKGESEFCTLLANTPFLVGLPAEVIAEVAAACEVMRIPGESRLVRRDEPSESLYVVVHGGLRTMSRDPSGRERMEAESFRGDSLGLVELVGGVCSFVDVYAVRDCVLLRLTRPRFATLAARHPEFLLRLAEALAQRGVQLVARQPALTAWACPGVDKKNLALLVPTSDPYFAGPACELFFAALERYQHVTHVSRELVEAALGAGAAESALSDPVAERLIHFLYSLETRSDVVLYECDTRSPEWSARCLRQADRVLALVRPDRPDHIAELRPLLESTLRRRQPPRLDVALVHASNAQVPGGWKDWAWLAGQARIHHVHMGDRSDYERVARTMLGLAVGVVLSGGGARGIAHVGVLKALEEANVPVDYVAGTSMGAIFAAGYARGWNADALMAKVRQLFQHRTALYDPTIPFESLLAGHKLEQVLRGSFEGLDIEGLWLPFFCVSTDLTRAEAHLHDRGELWRAVAASCSIPGIFPPRHEGGRLLVDGGVVDNLPVAHMAERLKGKIVASDVNVFREVTPEPTPRSTISRVLDFVRWINPLSSGGSSPEVFELLLRSSMVGSQHTARRSLERGEVSLYLPLPVERIGLLDWGAHEQLYRVGREFATGRIAAWRPE